VVGEKIKTLSSKHPDHSTELSRLRKISGQLQGIERMIQERRYCPEVVQQIRAASSALKAVEIAVITKHMNQCLTEAAHSRDPEPFQRKISELIRLMKG
jgi:DNA-binding FrmR family transcriptional regulator